MKKRIKRTYFAINVSGVTDRRFAYLEYKNEVYISKTGKLCGPGKERQFSSKKDANEFLVSKQFPTEWEFSINEITAWVEE